MKRFKNILFVKEPTTGSEAALERAVTLAQNNQARLTVIDVVEQLPPGFEAVPTGFTWRSLQQTIVEERREQLEQFAAVAGKTIALDVRLFSGVPYLEIIRKVLRDQHDLVVKPADSGGALKARLFGSTDLHLLRKCPAPIWLMKAPATAKLNKILAAVDIGHETEKGPRDALSLQILELAGSLALAEFCELHIVHAWEVVGENILRGGRGGLSGEEVDSYVEEERERHRRWVEQLFQEATAQLSREAIDYIKPQVHLPKGWAKEVIPHLVRDIDADLLVMGTVARTGVPGFFMGNTAEMIINSVDCSLLAVKPDGFMTPVTLTG